MHRLFKALAGAAILLGLFQACILQAQESTRRRRPPRRTRPKSIGDDLGASTLSITLTDRVNTSISGTGFILSGTGADSVLGFDVVGNSSPDDLFSTGIGIDTNADGIIDSFAIAEPFPPSDAPLSPGSDFNFDGGTASFSGDREFVDGDQWDIAYSFSRQLSPGAGAGGNGQGNSGQDNPGGVAIRRSKLTENNSPIPDSRIYFNFNFFRDTLAGGGDVRRYIIGFEHACECGASSIDFRLPFAATLDSTQFVDGVAMRGVELGNISILGKHVIYNTGQDVMSVGMGLTVPTADDLRYFRVQGGEILRIRNERITLLPFAGWFSERGRWNLQLMSQLDFDLTGNPVFANTTGGPLRDIGKINDAPRLFMDLSVSYWLIRRNTSIDRAEEFPIQQGKRRGLTGVAPTAELHYSTMFRDADVITDGDLSLASYSTRAHILNATVGSHFFFAGGLSITPAIVFPLRNDDRPFDYEALILANQRY